MANSSISRRGILAAGSAAVGMFFVSETQPARAASPATGFRFSLNGCTIWGTRNLPLIQQIEAASKAGYDGFEPWLRDIEAYVKTGGTLPDLRKRFADASLTVENAIGFAAWLPDDEAARKKGLEQFKHDMDIVAQIGGKRIAAPPVGNVANIDLLKAAERYRTLCELGQQFNVAPQIEIWGHSKTLSKLGEALFVAAESGHRLACVLADIYHMYKAGSDYGGFRIASAQAIQEVHMNDYPADPPRATIGDANRIYPGDGIAPFPAILRDIRAINPNCVLSLELFNREYWKQDALTIARTGLAKMKAAVESSSA